MIPPSSLFVQSLKGALLENSGRILERQHDIRYFGVSVWDWDWKGINVVVLVKMPEHHETDTGNYDKDIDHFKRVKENEDETDTMFWSVFRIMLDWDQASMEMLEEAEGARKFLLLSLTY